MKTWHKYIVVLALCIVSCAVGDFFSIQWLAGWIGGQLALSFLKE